MHSAVIITLRHLLVDDAAPRRHPLDIAGGDGATVPEAVAVLDTSREDVRDGLDPAVGMPWEASQVILRTVIPEVVEEEKRVEFGRVAEAERAAQVNSRAFQGRLRLDEPLNGSKGHVDLQYQDFTLLNAGLQVPRSSRLRETPEGELKRSVEVQFHSMVFATPKEIRKYCLRYHYLPGEGILDFSTDCASAQLEPGDLGQAPPPKRGRFCKKCCFFAGIPEEQLPETTVSAVSRDLVLVA
jgi:hypothetical protein